MSRNTKIKVLSLSKCEITDLACFIIGKGLKRNMTIEKLDLSCNEITDVGLSHICNSLASTNSGIKILNLA